MATSNKRQRDDVDLARQEHARSVRPDQDGERKHDAHRNRADAADPARIERVAISSLVPDPANVRKHGAKNLDAIKGSLARFGQQKPIVVSAAGVVVAGNGTLAAAVALGWTEIDVVRSPLVGSEATAYAIADNRTAELAEWDDDALAQTLAALAIDDAALAEATGFDASEVAQTLQAIETTPPSEFAIVDESIETEHQCPKCGYQWSGGKVNKEATD